MRIGAVGSAYFGQKSAGTSQSKTLGAGQFNNPSFGAVDQKFIKWAENNYKHGRNIDGAWMHRIMEVNILGLMSDEDAKDTLIAARKYVSADTMKLYDRTFKYLLYPKNE